MSDLNGVVRFSAFTRTAARQEPRLLKLLQDGHCPLRHRRPRGASANGLKTIRKIHQTGNETLRECICVGRPEPTDYVLRREPNRILDRADADSMLFAGELLVRCGVQVALAPVISPEPLQR